MKTKPKRRKCRCCSKFFFPDYRNWQRQHYCAKPGCRQASKFASQRRWHRKPENYSQWRRHPTGTGLAQAAPASQAPQPTHIQAIKPEQASRSATRDLPLALQDFCLAQEPAFIGLILMFTGSALQDDIAVFTRRLVERGCNILGQVLPAVAHIKTDTRYDHQTAHPTLLGIQIEANMFDQGRHWNIGHKV